MKKQPTPMAQLTEQELDAMLQSANIPTPYDGLIPKISPWRQSMKLLVWGMMFTSIKLEFWNLHYILPALGAILFLLALLPFFLLLLLQFFVKIFLHHSEISHLQVVFRYMY